METVFQLLDCDYVLVDGLPTIRLFGKTEDGKTVCGFVKKFMPYFYLQTVSDGEAALVGFLRKEFPSHVLKVEEVGKFIPHGYQPEKTQILKITIKDPSAVPQVREKLQQQKFVKEIFEADVLFKYRFLADWKLFPMRWYRADGNASMTKTVKADKKFDIADIQEVVDRPTQLKVMSVDIEIASGEGLPDATEDPIAMVSLAFDTPFRGSNTRVLVAKPTFKTDGDVSVFRSESDMLKEFLKILDDFNPDVIAGYNINNFDLPYIIERLAQNKLSKAIGRDSHKPVVSRKVAGNFRNSMIGRFVVDVYNLIKEMQVKTQLAEKGFPKLKRYGLGDVAHELLNEDKISITHSEIPKMWNGDEAKMKLLIDYARRDAELTLKLLTKLGMVDKFIELSKISGLILQDTMDSGESSRVENMLLREFNEADFVLPIRPGSVEILRRTEERVTRGFKGALVLEPVVGLQTTSVIYLDFKSMYPSIFISFNICPSTIVLDKGSKLETIVTPNNVRFVAKNIREGIMPKVIRRLIQERDKVREEAKKTDDEGKRKLLEAKQIALKYMTNSFYGYTGYDRARLYMLDVAGSITACGRFLIEKTKAIVEKDSRFAVIYGDTDSIMVKTNLDDAEKAWLFGQELEERVNKELAGTIQMKIESVFKSLVILSKKRYAGLSMEKTNGGWNEKMMMKGIETVRRDWCDLTSETLDTILNIILREQNPKKALTFMRDVISKLEKNQIGVDKLVVTKSLSKSLHSYKGIQPHVELVKKMRKRDIAEAPGVGDRVGFVVIQGSQLLSERAEDPEYAKKHGLKIDSKYYIETQILPPLERVFEAIGISRSELLHAGKQLLLTDAIRNGHQKPAVQTLHEIDGFTCNVCSRQFNTIPMVGKCFDCGGELLFSNGAMKARYFSP